MKHVPVEKEGGLERLIAGRGRKTADAESGLLFLENLACYLRGVWPVIDSQHIPADMIEALRPPQRISRPQDLVDPIESS